MSDHSDDRLDRRIRSLIEDAVADAPPAPRPHADPVTRPPNDPAHGPARRRVVAAIGTGLAAAAAQALLFLVPRGDDDALVPTDNVSIATPTTSTPGPSGATTPTSNVEPHVEGTAQVTTVPMTTTSSTSTTSPATSTTTTTTTTSTTTTSLPAPGSPAINVDDLSIRGWQMWDTRGPEAAISDLRDPLGEPTFDTGWLPMPDEWRCTQMPEYRTVWWGDVRLTFERSSDRLQLSGWSVGIPSASYAPQGAVPPLSPASGAEMADGVGIGASRSSVLAALGDRDLVFEQPDGISVGGALVLVIPLDTDDRVAGFGVGRTDCIGDI
jgi:hypothetical protein